jgi:hypothetical protein
MPDVRIGSEADSCTRLSSAQRTGLLKQNDFVSDKKVNSVMFCRFRGYERRVELGQAIKSS